ncbi:9877_t:CDS:2, partial [Gigaspora rosea]
MKFFNDKEFTQEMCERVEFYLNVVKLKPLQIQRALQKEFPDREICLSEIHKITARFYCEKRKDMQHPSKNFTAGIQTTSRVESYNAQIKRLVLNSNISLVKLAKVLDTSINKESKKAKFVYWKTQIPLTSSAVTLPQALFPEVDNALRRFLTPAMLKVQCDEIKSCLNYQVSAITENELIGFQEPEPNNTQFVEDDEDIMQISVNY